MVSEPERIAIDSDVLMNLLATRCAVEILRALNLLLLVPPAVAAEILYLESEEPNGEREQIDLAPLEAAGVLTRIDLTDPELNLVLDLARVVDDGEAEVIAVALTRTLTIATDDRKARRVAMERGATLLSTPEVLHRWQSQAEASAERMSQVLNLIGRRSRYRPRSEHPLYRWWMSLIEPQ